MGWRSGRPYLIGNLFIVALTDADSGDEFTAETCGVFDLPKLTTEAIAQGDALYWNNAANSKKLTKTKASGLFKVGVAIQAESASSPTVAIRLDGIATIAES